MGYSCLKTIPELWEIGEIENYLELIIDYRGKTPKKANAGIRTLSARSVKNGKIDYAQAYFISEKTFEEWETRGKPKPGDVLLTTEGPLGEVAQLGSQRVALAQRLIGLRGKERKLDNAYLKYYLISPIGKNELLSKASGTTVQGIKQSEFRKIKLIKPPYKEQVAIASILSNLDAKIELNERMNRTLDTAGEAVFKRWFVDFEFPNQEGKPYKSSGGEMESTDFGEIPRGWSIKPLSEVIAVNPVRRIEKGAIGKKVEMADLNPWQPWIMSFSFGEYKSGSRFQNGDTLLARITPCLENGKTGFVSLLDKNEVAFGSTEFIVLGPKTIQSSYFILYWAISKNLRASAILSMTGSSGRQRVPNDFFDDFMIAVPPDDLLSIFDGLVAPMFAKITNNVKESGYLKEIRDLLLPKLMSGKIRVPLEKQEA